MSKIKINVFIILLGLFLNSCLSLRTSLSIPERKVPETFHAEAKDSSSIAQLSWREYFTEPYIQKLIETGLTNNIELAMAWQKIELARAHVSSSSRELFPKLHGEVTIGTHKYSRYSQEYLGNSTTEFEPGQTLPNPIPSFSLGFTSSWEIDIWGKLRNQRKAAVMNYLASIEGRNFLLSNLISDIATTYYELLALDNELEMIQQTIHKQSEALEVVKAQKESMRTNELAVQQFQAQLLHFQSLEQEISQKITETENKINFLLGRFPQAIERKKEDLFQEPSIPITYGLPAQLLRYRPDILEAERLVEASKLDLKAARAAFFPNLNLSANLSLASFNPTFLFQIPAAIAYSVITGLSNPLINRNRLQWQFKTAKAKQLSAMYYYQLVILQAYMEVSNERSQIQRLQDISVLKQQQSESLKQAVNISIDLYKTTKANYLEVLLAHQNSLQTQVELIEINKRKKITLVHLYKSLGGGWK